MSSTARRAGSALAELINRTGDPGNVANRLRLYCKAVSGVSQLFAELSDGTVIQITPGLGARQIVNEMWAQNSVAASQSAVALSGTVSQLFDSWTAFRAGNIVGLRTKLDTAVTAGTLTARVAVNGVAGTLNVASTNASNQSGGLSTQTSGDTFAAGDLLSIQITTDSGFLPVTLNMEAYLEIYVNNV